MTFCAVVNCMDGRVQLPVIRHLQERFGVDYVDTITEPGPVRFLAARPPGDVASAICRRVAISVDAHGSDVIAVAAHTGCAANPIPDEEQHRQIEQSAAFLSRIYPQAAIVGLWVDADWCVHTDCEIPPSAG